MLKPKEEETKTSYNFWNETVLMSTVCGQEWLNLLHKSLANAVPLAKRHWIGWPPALCKALCLANFTNNFIGRSLRLIGLLLRFLRSRLPFGSPLRSCTWSSRNSLLRIFFGLGFATGLCFCLSLGTGLHLRIGLGLWLSATLGLSRLLTIRTLVPTSCCLLQTKLLATKKCLGQNANSKGPKATTNN